MDISEEEVFQVRTVPLVTSSFSALWPSPLAVDINQFLSLSEDPKFRALFVEFAKVMSDADEAKKFKSDMRELRRALRKFEVDENLDVSTSPKQQKLDYVKKSVLSSKFQSEFYIVANAKVYEAYQTKSKRIFIHVCSNEQISDAHSVRLCSSHGDHNSHGTHSPSHKHKKMSGKTDNMWEIPFASMPPVKVCNTKLYTVAFGNRTLARMKKFDEFKSTLVLTALEIIEEEFSESIFRDDVSLVDPLSFKQNFLPPNFSPIQNLDFTKPKPDLIDYQDKESPNDSLKRIKDFSEFDEKTRSSLRTVKRAYLASCPANWPKHIPFRKFRILGFHLNEKFDRDSIFTFPNYTIEQNEKEIVVIVERGGDRLSSIEFFQSSEGGIFEYVIVFGEVAIYLALSGGIDFANASTYRREALINTTIRIPKIACKLFLWPQ